jgi:hypothetical protein
MDEGREATMNGSLKRTAAAAAAALVFGAAGLSAQGAPTEIVVRAVAHDAKVVGSSVGGARITVTDAESGAVLAEGVQEGGTGDTDLIMRQPRDRRATVFGTADAAAFRATLALEAPTVVEVTAEGPLGTPHAARTASRTLLLLPGRDVTGEGVVLVLQGLAVEIDVPGDGAERVRAGGEVPVRATVEMMCGCPFTPGGLWDADRVDVTARLSRGGRTVVDTDLRYAGDPSTFGATLPAPAEPGTYELVVVAAQQDADNFGLARTEVRVDAGG